MIFVLMSCFGGCGYWRRRQLLLAQQHHAMLHSAGYNDLFNRRLRSLRNAAAAHAHHRHHMQHVPVYAGFDSTFPPIASNFTHNMAPSTRGPPEGMFPQPPPYSEVRVIKQIRCLEAVFVASDLNYFVFIASQITCMKQILYLVQIFRLLKMENLVHIHHSTKTTVCHPIQEITILTLIKIWASYCCLI